MWLCGVLIVGVGVGTGIKNELVIATLSRFGFYIKLLIPTKGRLLRIRKRNVSFILRKEVVF